MAASQDWLEKDFYAALGVSKDATDAQIKKAYNTYARKYHPDRNPGDKAAEEKFKAASEAYQVLSNAEDRKQYDAIRSMSGGGARFSGGGGGFEDIFSAFSGQGGSARFSTGGGLDDIISQMFGGQAGAQTSSGFGGFSGFSSRRRPQKGKDTTAEISIPLRHAIDGTTVTVSANGNKVTAKIPQGITDGQKIRIKGKGGPGQNGGENGDILITVHVEPHPVYELKGSDVYVNVPVSFDEAALGATIEVPTVHGKWVKVKVPAGSSTDKLLRVRRKGVQARRGETGDMYVRLKVAVPGKLSGEAKAAAQAYRDATAGQDPRAEFNELASI